jgi:hypothetical protein
LQLLELRDPASVRPRYLRTIALLTNVYIGSERVIEREKVRQRREVDERRKAGSDPIDSLGERGRERAAIDPLPD